MVYALMLVSKDIRSLLLASCLSAILNELGNLAITFDEELLSHLLRLFLLGRTFRRLREIFEWPINHELPF